MRYGQTENMVNRLLLILLDNMVIDSAETDDGKERGDSAETNNVKEQGDSANTDNAKKISPSFDRSDSREENISLEMKSLDRAYV